MKFKWMLMVGGSALLLSGCAPGLFGVSRSNWDSMSDNQQQQTMINYYQHRQHGQDRSKRAQVHGASHRGSSQHHDGLGQGHHHRNKGMQKQSGQQNREHEGFDGQPAAERVSPLSKSSHKRLDKSSRSRIAKKRHHKHVKRLAKKATSKRIDKLAHKRSTTKIVKKTQSSVKSQRQHVTSVKTKTVKKPLIVEAKKAEKQTRGTAIAHHHHTLKSAQHSKNLVRSSHSEEKSATHS